MLGLLIFAPVAPVLDALLSVPAPFLFFSTALSMAPIARLIVEGRENLSLCTGPPLEDSRARRSGTCRS